MPSGGKRSGAGRPKGSRSKRNEILALAAMAEGVTPLEFLLGVMRDSAVDASMRLDAAKAAAGYVHARLASTELKGPNNEALVPVITFRMVYMDANGNSLIGVGSDPDAMKTIDHQ
jgi:hypothetical protein